MEVGVLAAGTVSAVCAVLYAGRDAFRANTAWTEGTETLYAIALTLASLAIVAAIATAPYVVLYLLGRLIPPDAFWARIAGLGVSVLTLLAGMFLYYEATSAIHGPGARSTAPILFALFPAFLLVASAAPYALVIVVHRLSMSAARRPNRQD